MTDISAFLASRRSVPARLLAPPLPDAAQLSTMLAAATRVPDHGKLEPWRMLVLTRPACQRLAALIDQIGTARGDDPERLAKTIAGFSGAHLIVAIVACPVEHRAIPAWEQHMSAGGVCLGLLNAAEAMGFRGNWLTGWPAVDHSFLTEGLGLSATEFVAGFVHLGTATDLPPDRPRPDPATKTVWVTS